MANHHGEKHMSKFQILSGKALKSAIAGRGKAVDTFKEREHQIAVSCLHHVEAHSDVVHLNGMLSVTPSNYRRALILWACAFGKVTWNNNSKAFAFAKGKKSNLDGAESVAPADYEKEKKASEKAAPAFDIVKYLERIYEKLDAIGADPRILANIDGAYNIARGKVPAKAAAPVKPAPVKADLVDLAEQAEKIAA
jgi:hypothetical protein